MQLSEDQKKIIFDTSDFKHLRQILMRPPHSLTSSRADHQVKEWIQKTSEIVNRRLQYFLKGKRAPERLLKYAFEVFRYIWNHGNQPDSRLIFVGVARKEISNNLVQIRRIGRPKKVGAPKKSDDKKYRYEFFENNPIPNATTISRIFNGLIEAELIKMEIGIKPGKKQENTFYRISPACFDNAITPEEKLEKSLIKIIKDDQQVGKEILAREWILACNGLTIPQETVNEWIKMWDAGDREIVYGYGSRPTPFKIDFKDTDGLFLGNWVFSDFIRDAHDYIRRHPPNRIKSPKNES